MKVTQTSLSGVLILEPKVFADDRGFFLESYNQVAMAQAGIAQPFVQDNHSYSARNVVRGLHYQLERPQGKLIRVVLGEIYDVALDLRRGSSTFGQWVGIILSAANRHMLWIPAGFAHGFSVRSDGAHVLYKATDFYHPASERTVLWNDPALKIDWQIEGSPIISAKDAAGIPLSEAETFS